MTILEEEKQYWMTFINDNKYRYYHDRTPLLKDAPEHIQKDWDIALHSILVAKENVYNVHPFLTQQKNFLLEVIEKYTSCSLYVHFPKNMQENLELFHLSYAKSCSDLRYLPSHLKRKPLLLELMKINGLGLEFVPPDLKDDDDMIHAALNNNVAAIQFVSKKKRITLCHDKILVEKILEEVPNCFPFLSLKIRNNLKYATQAIRAIPSNLEHSPKIRQDELLVKKMIEEYKCSIYHASDELSYNLELNILSLKKGTASFFTCLHRLNYNYRFCCEGVAIQASNYKDVPQKYKYCDEIIENLVQHQSFYLWLEEDVKNQIENIKKNDPTVDVKQLFMNIVLDMKLQKELEHKPLVAKRKI